MLPKIETSANIPHVDLSITAEPAANGRTRLRLSGSVDLVSRDTLLDHGRKALLDTPGGLLLNLSEVRFMDSAGIGTLISLSREAEDGGAGFAIEEPSQRVQRLLTLTGLHDAWTEQPPSELT